MKNQPICPICGIPGPTQCTWAANCLNTTLAQEKAAATLVPRPSSLVPKLAAIYNLWDAEEHLLPSIRLIAPHVDHIIIIWQEISNYGEYYNPWYAVKQAAKLWPQKIIHQKYEPKLNFPSSLEEGCRPATAGPAGWSYRQIAAHETAKRNLGLDIARAAGATHFLHLDADEYWPNFTEAKALYFNSHCDGSVACTYTYFKQPNWRLQHLDNYYVPFIHKLKQDTRAGARKYHYYVDPTRRITGYENDSRIYKIPAFPSPSGEGARRADEVAICMHHLSWVRQNIERKINNSTARKNLQRSGLLADYNNPNLGPGYYIADMHQSLIEVDPIM